MLDKIDEGKNMKEISDLFLQRHKKTPCILAPGHVEDFVKTTLTLLYPHFCDHVITEKHEIDFLLAKIKTKLAFILENLNLEPQQKIDQYIESLSVIAGLLDKDAESILQGDPAATTFDEIILSYPGFYAIATYRLANELHRQSIPILPRMMTEYAHSKTGIDIHPGATIGESFFIDHGTGIVIGETSIIGNNVKIYQGVTLGSLSVKKRLQNTKRHPTIEDNVVIYANATILGGDTVIGANSVIGGSTWITSSIAPNSQILKKET
jgi:serine O-acetyltransferase